MEKGLRFWTAVVGVLLLGVLLAGCRSVTTYDSQAIGDAVKMVAVTYLNEPNEAGYLVVPMNEDYEARKFVNVVADLNQDGLWKNYSAEGRVQEEWVVKNVPLHVSAAEPYSFSFEFNDPDAPKREDIKLRVVLTDKVITAADATVGWDGTVPEGAAAARDVAVARVDIDEFGDILSPDPTGLMEKYPDQTAPATASDSTPDGGFPLAAEAVYAAAAEELDFHRAGVPDINQRRNECVPTSTANSLLWLANEYGFKDKMPDTADKVIQELRSDMNWGEAYDEELKRHVGGVNVLSDFLNGKKKFIDRHGLPIEGHQVGGRFDSGIFEKIVAELKKGQDVEISLEFKYNGKRIGGHMVTVVGAQTYTFDDGSRVQMLAFHDPASRPGPTTDYYPVFLTKLYGYRYTPGKTREGYETHIRFAFADSPVAKAPAEEPPQGETPPAGGGPATGGEPSTGDSPPAGEPAPPARPTGVEADNSVSCQISIYWTDCSDDEYGFEIERKAPEKDWTRVHTTGPDVTSWTNHGYDPPPMSGGVVYSYRVRAFKVVDSKRVYSGYSEVASAEKR